MAGLFYLPRIFVYHVERSNGTDQLNEVFLVMEKKLHSFIMNPAMILSWICGILLSLTPGIIDFSELCITSKAEVDYKDDIDTSVITSKAKGTKCPVCWKINEGPCPRHS